MPRIERINKIFPSSQGPFLVCEITRRLQKSYSPRITRDGVYDALRTLKKRDATAEIVQPLDSARPAFYSVEAARLIARYATLNIEIERAEFPSGEEISTSGQLPATPAATTPELDIAA